MTVCAVDIGGTWTKIALVDDSGNVEHFHRIPTAPPTETYFENLLTAIQSARSRGDVCAIGVSLAGFIDPSHSRLIYNPNLRWLEDFPIRSRLSAVFDLPVTVEVDSNAAALAEYRFGEGRGSERFLCLTIGTGIGGGFLIHGEPVRFTHECIGDVGHVIVEPGGRLCTCGGRGCAEAVATAPAIIGLSGVTLEDLAVRPESAALFQNAGKHIGLLAASLASIFFPDCIALCGGVPDASGLVLAAAQRSFAVSASDHGRTKTRLVQARLGSRASLIGATSSHQNER